MFWELLTGAGLVGFILGCVTLNPVGIWGGLLFLIPCLWHWSRYA